MEDANSRYMRRLLETATEALNSAAHALVELERALSTRSSDEPTIGERLRRYRRRNALTQAESADWLDVDQSTVAKWERGDRMDLRHVKAIAEWIGEPVAELVEQYLRHWGG